MAKYDFLIVGSGLTGATIARELTDNGKRCLVLERRDHVGGNIYTELIDGIHVHRYGPHIFHTNDDSLWAYINRFVHMNRFTNCPLANYRGSLYNLPFNMNTFHKLWGVTTPQQAMEIISRQKAAAEISAPGNLEEQAISMVGTDIYEILIKGYTEKQWGRPCSELPPEIIRRLPVRYTFDNNYFNAKHQGVPEEGYTALIDKLLGGSDVETGTDFLLHRAEYSSQAEKIVYTGAVDEYFDYCYGPLEYRTVDFELERLNIANFQGNAVVNYTDAETPYTRIIEHKHFAFGTQPTTVISREYSRAWKPGLEPYYPINDTANQALYRKYQELSERQHNTVFCGRLGRYQYADMDKAIGDALALVEKLL